MKKRLLILVILTMFFSVFAKENFTNTENGTYIPLRMYKTVAFVPPLWKGKRIKLNLFGFNFLDC